VSCGVGDGGILLVPKFLSWLSERGSSVADIHKIRNMYYVNDQHQTKYALDDTYVVKSWSIYILGQGQPPYVLRGYERLM